MRRAAFVLLPAAVLAACGGGPKDIEQESNRTAAAVTVSVRGAQTIDFDGRTTIVIYRTLDPRIPRGVRLFSVGMPPPHVEIRPGVRFRAAFDVLGFKGDGRYQIPPNVLDRPPPGPSGLPLPSGIQSNAFVEVLRPAMEPVLLRYDVALEPCRVSSRDQGRIGSVSCPKLRRDAGEETISLEMTWDALTT